MPKRHALSLRGKRQGEADRGALFPARCSIHMRPRWRSTNFLLTARPNPLPWVNSSSSRRSNASKARKLVWRNAAAAILHQDGDLFSVACGAEMHRALFRVAHGVGQQVEQHLANADAIQVDRQGAAGRSTCRWSLRASASPRTISAASWINSPSSVRSLWMAIRPRFDLREIEARR